jgi:hypothetical protein
MEVEIKTNYRMKELLTTLQRKEEEIYQSQVNINNIKKFASELQAFVGLKQIQGISIAIGQNTTSYYIRKICFNALF